MRLEYPGTISTAGSSSCDPLGTAADPNDRASVVPVTVAPVTEIDSRRAAPRGSRPSTSLLRFVLRRLGRLPAPDARDHVRRVRAHRARAEQRRRDEPRRAGGGRSRPRSRPSRSTTASTSRCPSGTLIYLEHLVHGDLGQSSLTHQAVTHDLGQFIPATAELALYSILFAAVVGVAFGVDRGAPPEPADRPRAARRLARGHLDADVLDRADRRSTSASTGSAGSRAASGSTPARARRRASPACTRSTRCSTANVGLFGTAFHHLLLPALVLAAFNVSLLTRFTRSAVLEVVGNDYVRAARAKGMPERIVVLRYILRAALPSVVTVLGLVFANVLTGAVLVEKIFSWPGVGQYAYQAAVNVDVPAIAGVSLFVAASTSRSTSSSTSCTASSTRGSGSRDAPASSAARSLTRRRRIHPGLRQPLAVIGLVIVAAWIVIAVFAPLIAPADPLDADLHAVGRAVVAAPVRHRRARPRRPEPRALRRAGDAAARAPPRRARRDHRRDRSARSPATSAARSTALCMRSTDLVFAFPPIILAMVVAAVLGRGLAERRDRDRDRRVAAVRARRARARAQRRRQRSTCSRPACSARAPAARSSATCCRTSPGRCSC